MNRWIALALAANCYGVAPARAEATLKTNKIVCNSLQDIKDLLSMAGKGDEGIPLVAAKLRQGECRQWFAGANIKIDRKERVAISDGGRQEEILCARRSQGDDMRCFWTFPGGVQE